MSLLTSSVGNTDIDELFVAINGGVALGALTISATQFDPVTAAPGQVLATVNGVSPSPSSKLALATPTASLVLVRNAGVWEIRLGAGAFVDGDVLQNGLVEIVRGSPQSPRISNFTLTAVDPFMVNAGARVSKLGDSISQQESVGGSSFGIKNQAMGELVQVQTLDPFFRRDDWYDNTGANATSRNTLGSNRGVNGERTDQIMARIDADILTTMPDVVVVAAGTNNVVDTTSITTLAAGVTKLLNAGLRVVLGTLRPSDPRDTRALATLQARNTEIRNLVATRNDRGLILWDAYAQYANLDGYLIGTANNEAWNAAQITYDTLHPNDRGAEVGAWGRGAAADPYSLRTALRKFIRAGSIIPAMTSGANLFTNPKFAGVGGVKTAGITGVVPDGWRIDRQNAAFTSTVVCSTELIPGTIDSYRLVLTITPNGVLETERFLVAPAGYRIGTAGTPQFANKWMRTYARVTYEAAEGLLPPNAQFTVYSNGAAGQSAVAFSRGYTGTPQVVRTVLPIARRRELLSDALLLPTAADQLVPTIDIGISPLHAASGPIVVKIEAPWIGEAANPKPAWNLAA